MNKILSILFLLCFAFSAKSQTYVAQTQVRHGDTLFLKKTTYTYSIDSETRYVYSNHYEYDTTSLDPITIDTLLVLDTVPYTHFFKVITNTVSDSVQLNKWPVFVSGNNIKTIKGQAVLGSGDIPIVWGDLTGTLANQTDLQTALNGKLATNGNGSSLTGLTSAQVGLSNTTNESKATMFSSPTFTGTVSGVTAAMVGLGNVNNTSDANKPISTTTQTALDAKQATLVSATNIKTINGASVLGSGDLVVNGTGLGYTLDVQALTSSPADGATIYFGQLPKAPVTVAATSKIFIRKAGTIKIANIYCFSGTAGTAEAWPVSIRLNNTTDTQIASIAAGASERIFSNTSLNIPVIVGDYIEIKCVNPTWATNPLTTIFGGYIYIE